MKRLLIKAGPELLVIALVVGALMFSVVQLAHVAQTTVDQYDGRTTALLGESRPVADPDLSTPHLLSESPFSLDDGPGTTGGTKTVSGLARHHLRGVNAR